MIEEITSSANSKLKLAKSLLIKKNRTKNKMYTVEGIKSVTDAFCAGADIKMIIVSEENIKMCEQFSGVHCVSVKRTLFDTICDTKAPQGILAIIAMQEKNFEYSKEKMYICCENVKDPGNLGTIIRTADAAGFAGVLLLGECADLYNPKTVRSSMGSFFHIPIYENIKLDDIRRMKSDGFKLFCGALSENTADYTEADYLSPFVICVGNEADGITEEMLDMADMCVKIPIFGAAESLNVGVASAILMYRAQEARRKKVVD